MFLCSWQPELCLSVTTGTYGYMAPEQFRGAAQPASDLYALGGTLLYLLSGTVLVICKWHVLRWPLVRLKVALICKA